MTFGNQCYNDNGRDLSKCPPTLAFQTFTDQQDNTGQFRINDGIQFDETLGWFLPGRHGDHDLRHRRPVPGTPAPTTATTAT